ncbi:Mce-associated membrane protein [Mycobacterium sp. MAA66]|uniref:Mce protein n=1 Tax=Mycobacterium sp. MAA66 TaxID=3156297 RepID=UPI0035146BC3
MADEGGGDKHGRHRLPDDSEVPSSAVEESETVADEAETETEVEESEAEIEAPAVRPVTTKVSLLDPRDRVALIIGVVAVVVLGALAGWVGYRAYHEHQTQPPRELFLEAGRRGAQSLTTIDYNQVDADVKRVLDTATGTFYDDFNRRAASFTDVVKQLKSKSTGTITEAAVESTSGDTAKVLVAVTVNTEVADGPPQPVRAFRMRLTVQKVGADAKVSNVEFVQ